MAQASGASWWGGIGDAFSDLVGVYGQVEMIKAQSKAQENAASYNQLYTMPQDLFQNPNAQPLNAQQWAAYLNQQNGMVGGGLTNQQLLLIAAGLGVVLLVIYK